MIYFVRLGATGPVKIGHTSNLRSRLSALQNAHHERLTLIRLAEGSRDEERFAHSLFEEHRIRGEWFTFTPAMFEEIGLDELPLPIAGKRGPKPEEPKRPRGRPRVAKPPKPPKTPRQEPFQPPVWRPPVPEGWTTDEDGYPQRP